MNPGICEPEIIRAAFLQGVFAGTVAMVILSIASVVLFLSARDAVRAWREGSE